MVMKDDDAIKNVLAYLKDERCRQAVLIDGEWGAGKTFFVKENMLIAYTVAYKSAVNELKDDDHTLRK